MQISTHISNKVSPLKLS